MITMSRLRRSAANVALIAFFLAFSLGAESCFSRGCTAIGCLRDGLDIQFDGDLPANAILDIQIDNVEQGLPPSPIITCVLSSSAGGVERLLCTSYLAISQASPRTLQTHEVFEGVRVTISSSGTQLSQQTFTLSYTHTTPNGPDCGECVSSLIQIALPQITQP